MTDVPTCDIEGCDRDSEYLLPPPGDLCRTHAEQIHPETVRFLDTAPTGGDDDG